LFHLCSGYAIARKLGRRHYIRSLNAQGFYIGGHLEKITAIFPELVHTFIVLEARNEYRVAFAQKDGVMSCCEYEDPTRLRGKTEQFLVLEIRYAQNVRYFEDMVSEIRQILQFSADVQRNGDDILRRMNIGNSSNMCAHIRRSDFVEMNVASDFNASVRDIHEIASDQGLSNVFLFGDDVNFMERLGESLIGMGKREKREVKYSTNSEGVDLYLASRPSATDTISVIKSGGGHTMELGGEQSLPLGPGCESDGWLSQFIKQSENSNYNYTLTYDHGSVMHNAPTSVLKNGELIVVPHDVKYIQTLGSRMLSFYDKLMILAATTSFQTLEDRLVERNPSKTKFDYTLCHYWIQAPIGSTIEIVFDNFAQGLGYGGCSHARVETKTGKDKRCAGYRFCDSKNVGISLISTYNIVSVSTFNDIHNTKVVLRCRIGNVPAQMHYINDMKYLPFLQEPNADDTMELLRKLHNMEDEIKEELSASEKPSPEVLKAMKDYAKTVQNQEGGSIPEINGRNKVGSALFQGDMILTKEQAEEIIEDVNEDIAKHKKQGTRSPE
uniref:Astacin domain-containing protein n=1 Tax=Angiostrongylus costaricensis TaxID=334426 RepID=A0A158PMA4_ANGCS